MVRPAISSVSKRYTSAQRNAPRNYTTSRDTELGPVKDHNQVVTNNPITGGAGSQSRAPSGVGAIPGGGFGNTGGYQGASGVPQTGGGQVAKSPGGGSAGGGPQKTTGTQTNPYGKTTPPGQSPKDALTKALLQKILNDRKEGEKAVIRNPETKKISEVDREKAQLDEKTKAEAAKLTEAFKKDAVELDKSIKDFQEQFKEYLTGDKGNAKDKELNGILDDVMARSKADENGNEVGSNKYNPQGFFDAAEKLDNWVKDNPGDAEKYGEDLTKINDQVQSMKATAEEEIALHENKPETVFRASEKSASNSADEAGRLKESLDTASTDLSAEDKTKVDEFKTKLDSTMEGLNPAEGEKINIEESTESLAELKKSFAELPEAVRNNPELEASFKEVSDLGRVAVEGQELGRKMEPDSAKYQEAATEYIQGADKLDAAWAEHRTPAEREADIRESINDKDFVDKTIEEFDAAKSSNEEGSAIQPETSSPEAQRTENLGAEFAEDDFAAIDEVNQEAETPRSLTESLDLDIEDTVKDSPVDDIIDDIEDAQIEDAEIEDIEVEEIEIEEIEDLEIE